MPGIGYAYVTSQLGTSLTGDPRGFAQETRCTQSFNRHKGRELGLTGPDIAQSHRWIIGLMLRLIIKAFVVKSVNPA